MNQIQIFLNELEQEAQITRKMLSIVPNDKFDWQPHPKSMTIRRLVSHLAEIPGWIAMVLTTNELDFATSEMPPQFDDIQNTLFFFEKCVSESRAQLEAATEEELSKPWTMRNGDMIFFTNTKAEVIRMSFSQIIHHRAQLGVFLRLLDVSIPGSYGPSADEMMEMAFS
jgi:uncharacterized damage-inducible protein DinB